MLKKQIRLTQENEDRKRKEQEKEQEQKMQSEREIEIATALVGANTTTATATEGEESMQSMLSPLAVDSVFPAFSRGIDDKSLGNVLGKRPFDDNSETDMGGILNRPRGDEGDSDRESAIEPAARSLQVVDEADLEYHVIRPLLSLPQYEHLARTKSRPKLRCGMKDCRRHTSYYCVKCTRDLQSLHDPTNKKLKVYALCSPMVENNFYCFYRHALGLRERGEEEVEELKASEAGRPKRHCFHSKKAENSSSSSPEQPIPSSQNL